MERRSDVLVLVLDDDLRRDLATGIQVLTVVASRNVSKRTECPSSTTSQSRMHRLHSLGILERFRQCLTWGCCPCARHTLFITVPYVSLKLRSSTANDDGRGDDGEKLRREKRKNDGG
jgi:hypothetical protein